MSAHETIVCMSAPPVPQIAVLGRRGELPAVASEIERFDRNACSQRPAGAGFELSVPETAGNHPPVDPRRHLGQKLLIRLALSGGGRGPLAQQLVKIALLCP